jgi:hypothetical protein
MRYHFPAAAIASLITSGCACNWPTNDDLRIAAAIVRGDGPQQQAVFPLPTGCDEIRVYDDRKHQGSYRELRRINGKWEVVARALVIRRPLGYGTDE